MRIFSLSSGEFLVVIILRSVFSCENEFVSMAIPPGALLIDLQTNLALTNNSMLKFAIQRKRMREATLGLAPLLGKGIFNLKGF